MSRTILKRICTELVELEDLELSVRSCQCTGLWKLSLVHQPTATPHQDTSGHLKPHQDSYIGTLPVGHRRRPQDTSGHVKTHQGYSRDTSGQLRTHHATSEHLRHLRHLRTHFDTSRYTRPTKTVRTHQTHQEDRAGDLVWRRTLAVCVDRCPCLWMYVLPLMC